jgi:hypothetical protein
MQEQMAEWKIVTMSKRPPKGTLAETLWEAMTSLPKVPPTFDDPELSRFTKAIYFYLVPEGTGNHETSSTEVEAKLNHCRAHHWADLNLGISPRRLNSLFIKLLTVTVRWASQVAGEVACRIVNERQRHYKEPDLTAADRRLLDFRYGIYPELTYINIAFLHGNGPKFDAMVNLLYIMEARNSSISNRQKVLRFLHQELGLLTAFRKRRKLARAQEKRDNRERRPKPVGGADRRRAEHEADSGALPPDRIVGARDELARYLREAEMHLGKRDIERIRAMVDKNGDRAAAAKRLGISLEQFSRQWRQTTMPNLRRIAALRKRNQTDDD